MMRFLWHKTFSRIFVCYCGFGRSVNHIDKADTIINFNEEIQRTASAIDKIKQKQITPTCKIIIVLFIAKETHKNTERKHIKIRSLI